MSDSKEQEVKTSNDNIKVAIQGYQGAFHEYAARLLFKDKTVAIEPHDTFQELIASVEKEETVDCGLMAIENTIAGSLMANYRLLKDSSLNIVGEIHIRIEQNLMVLPGQKIENLTTVRSHPVAIVQCRDYFKNHPHIELINDIDTALSAKQIREENRKNEGAIASSLAAEIYELEIIAKGIETNKRNHTRFLLLSKSSKNLLLNAENTKVSLCFAAEHEVGSLHRILAVMAAYGANLTKIQSAPIIGKAWQYLFYIDFIANPKFSYKQVLDAIQPLTSYLRILGVYPKGEHIEK